MNEAIEDTNRKPNRGRPRRLGRTAREAATAARSLEAMVVVAPLVLVAGLLVPGSAIAQDGSDAPDSGTSSSAGAGPVAAAGAETLPPADVAPADVAPADVAPADVAPADVEGSEGASARDPDAPGAEYDGIVAGPFTLRGTIEQFARFRYSDGFWDDDVYGYASLSAEYVPEGGEGRRPFSKMLLNFQGSYNTDINSFPAGNAVGSGEYNPFFDIYDTYDSRFRGYIHELNLQAKDLFILEDLKLGRQTLNREEMVLFDGAYARTKRWNTLSFDVYGGVPAHLYEDSYAAGDAIAGAGVESRPIRELSVGADYMYVRDQQVTVPDADDHLYRFYGRYRPSREWTIGASGSWTNTRDRRQTFDVRYLSESFGLLGQFRFTRQNGIVDFMTNELSPYVFVMGSYAPYYQYQIDLHQPFLDHYGIGAGFTGRQLEDGDEEGVFNHEFLNAYVSLDAAELWQGMRAVVRGDLWESDGDDIYTAGFELEQKLWILRFRLGTSYSLYRFDIFTGTEKNRDRIYYAKIQWKLSRHVYLDTNYLYEKDSDAGYHIALGGIRIWF